MSGWPHDDAGLPQINVVAVLKLADDRRLGRVHQPPHVRPLAVGRAQAADEVDERVGVVAGGEARCPAQPHVLDGAERPRGIGGQGGWQGEEPSLRQSTSDLLRFRASRRLPSLVAAFALGLCNVFPLAFQPKIAVSVVRHSRRKARPARIHGGASRFLEGRGYRVSEIVRATGVSAEGSKRS